jgi:hypothetical protein
VYDYITTYGEEDNWETFDAVIKTQNRLFDRVSELQKKGIAPESAQGQAFAREFYDMIMQFTGGNFTMVSEISKIALTHGSDTWKRKVGFIGKALDAYFACMGYNPFEEKMNVV